MIAKAPAFVPSRLLLRPGLQSRPVITTRTLFNSSPSQTTTRIYDPIRNPSDLDTALLLSSSSRTNLITLFKTSLCSSCATISPLIRSILENRQDSSSEPPVGYAEVELDAPDAGELAMQYGIRSIPTLMAFDRREAQVETMVTRVDDLKNEKFLRDWIEREAKRGGGGGSGLQAWTKQ